jgi:DNA repair photolyase
MYDLKPAGIYVMESLQEDPRYMARLDRMLAAMGRSRDEVRWYDREDLAEAARELQTLYAEAEAPEGLPKSYARPLILTHGFTGEALPDFAAEFPDWPEGASVGIAQQLMGWFLPVGTYHPFEKDQAENRVCWPTFDFCTMCGCPHGCQYCGTGKDSSFITLAMNLEEYAEIVIPRTVAQHPWQKCFRLIGWGADQITVEPEYGAFDIFTRTLAEHDRYCYFHTAGTNVDWVADLPRKDRLIAVFSVTTEAIARDLEPGTGEHAYARFEAGARLNAMGVPVRYKFKPMIPIRNWREEYAKAIEYMMRVSKPESVGFCVIMWMSLEDVGKKVPLERLDPEYVEAAREAAEELKDNVVAPFPHEVRKEIYQFLIREVRKYDAEVPLYVSTESREMWTELAEELGQNPNAFFCGCTPVGVPGRKLSLSQGCPHSTFKPLAEGEGEAAMCRR